MAGAQAGPGLADGWLGALITLALGLLLLPRLAALLARLLAWREEVRYGPPGAWSRERLHDKVNRHGIARTDLDPRGKVFIRGELWSAEATEPVAVGEPVEVIDVRGLLLEVRPVVRDAATDPADEPGGTAPRGTGGPGAGG